MFVCLFDDDDDDDDDDYDDDDYDDDEQEDYVDYGDYVIIHRSDVIIQAALLFIFFIFFSAKIKFLRQNGVKVLNY